MANHTEKFMFNKDLDDATFQDRLSYASTAKLRSEFEQKPVVYSEDELQAEKQKSFQEGYQEALGSIEADVQKILGVLNEKIDHLFAYENDQEKNFQMETIAFSGKLFHKLFPDMLKDKESQLVEEYIQEKLHELIEKPKLNFFFAPSLLEPLKSKVEGFLKEKGYEGQCFIDSDDSLQSLECRIDWVNGGVEKRVSHLWDEFYKAFPETVKKCDEEQNKEVNSETQLENNEPNQEINENE